jgi:hypothetical protein
MSFWIWVAVAIVVVLVVAFARGGASGSVTAGEATELTLNIASRGKTPSATRTMASSGEAAPVASGPVVRVRQADPSGNIDEHWLVRVGGELEGLLTMLCSISYVERQL